MRDEIQVPEEYVSVLLICAAVSELPVESVVEIVLKFYLNRSETNG